MAKFESANQALQRIKNPENQDKIKLAVNKKYRLKVHAETITDVSEKHQGHHKLLQWIQNDVIQNKEVFNRFKGLIKPPFCTNELTESIFDQFSTVFNAKNSFRKVKLSNPEKESDAYSYLKKIGYDNFWKTQGFESFKTGEDDIIIVDLPQISEEIRQSLRSTPSPYMYILDIEKVQSIGVSCSSELEILMDDNDEDDVHNLIYDIRIEYISFYFGEGDEKKLAFFSDDFIRVFRLDKGIDDLSMADMEVESPIDLGYCPAKQFGTSKMNSADYIQKKGQLTNSLSQLDYLFMYTYMGQYHDLYAPFPIYAMYSSKCDYKDENGISCVNGYLNTVDELGTKHKLDCPKCKDKIKLGAGNLAEVRAPQNSDQVDLLAGGPIKIIQPSTENAQWVQDKIDYYKDVIFKSCVGKKETPINNQAVNEKQVDQIYESEMSVKKRVKTGFEIIDKWTLDTLMRLRYGDEFVSSSVSWGTPISSATEIERIQEYNIAKESGLPNYDLASRRETLYEDKYKDDPDKLMLSKIMQALEPFPEMTVKEAIDSVKEIQSMGGDVTAMLQDLNLKMNFTNFIKKFESEVGDLLLFASAQDFGTKIELIKKELYSYGNERTANSQTTRREQTAEE